MSLEETMMRANAERPARQKIGDHNEATHLTRMSDSSLYDEVCVLCGAKDYAIGENEIRTAPCTVGTQIDASHTLKINDDRDTPFRGCCTKCGGDKLSVLKRECKAVSSDAPAGSSLLSPEAITRNFGLGAEFSEEDFAEEETAGLATGATMPGRYVASEDGSIVRHTPRQTWSDKVIETPIRADRDIKPIKPIEAKIEELMILTIDGHTHELDVATAEQIATGMRKSLDDRSAARRVVSNQMEAYFEDKDALKAMQNEGEANIVETPYGSALGPPDVIKYLATLVDYDLTPKPLPPSRTLEQKFEDLLNGYENESNTPDFILAQFMIGSLRAFNASITAREKWYGRDNVGPGSAGTGEPIVLEERQMPMTSDAASWE